MRLLQQIPRRLMALSQTQTVRQNEFIRSILAESLNRDEAMETFKLLDTNNDGNLTVKEISILFGQDTKALEHFVEKTVQYVSVDQQQMTFPDFLILMSQRRSDAVPRDADELIVGLGEDGEELGKGACLHPVRDLFKSYDIQRNGVIDANEMKEWMWAHGKFLTDNQARAIIDKIDQKKDGVIDYSEFLLVVARKILISKLEL